MLSDYEKKKIEQAIEGLDSLDRINFLLEVEELAEKKKIDTSRQNFVKRIQGCFTSLALEPNKAGELLDVIEEYVTRAKQTS